MKRPTIIAVDDVPRDFSNANIRRMASEADYAPAKLPGFAETVREAVRGLLEDLDKPTSNQVHHEIAALVRVAVRATRERKRPDYWFEQVARLVERLSPPARNIMNRRGTLPDAAMLRDPATQLDACHVILGLGRMGVRHELGRKRGEDEQGNEIRSVTEVSEVYGPKLQERPLRHEPHIVFVERLVNAHLRATSDLPPATANYYHPGSFAKFLQALLGAAGVSASAIKLLGARHWRWQSKRLDHLGQRWEKVLDDLFLHIARHKIVRIILRLSLPNR